MSRWEPKFTYGEVVDLFKDSGAEFLDSFYGNQHTLHNFKCSCGYVGKTRIITFKRKKMCRRCSLTESYKRRSIGIEKAREIFQSKGYHLLDNEFKNVDTRMKSKCPCGEVYEFSVTGVRNGVKCPKCVKKRFMGDKNPRWNPNLTDEERIANRDYSAYVKWREDVFEYFDYTCDLCGVRGGELNAHHIVPYSVSEDLRVDIDNGVPLCSDCHKKIHSDIPINEMNARTYREYENYNFPSSIDLEIDVDEEGELIYDTVIS